MAKGTDIKSALNQLEDTLEIYLVDKAPYSIPSEWKDLIVKFLPWIVIAGTLAAIQSVLSYLGLSSLVSQFGYAPGLRYVLMNPGNSIQLLIWGLIAVLEALAIQGLFKKQERSWKLLYYVGIINAVRTLFTFDIIGFVVGSLLSFYVLFQIKDYYS
ncbi:hypothetical protein HY041_00555 [Candidatus Roizmanbacteria bacterium]|nr:hypothetical protein [Candidatus Roizmanbacteria bacterium]